jgi:hypothetical protein
MIGQNVQDHQGRLLIIAVHENVALERDGMS